MGVKRLGTEVDCSPPSNVEIKNDCSYYSSPPVCLHGAYRKKFTLCTYGRGEAFLREVEANVLFTI